MRSFRLARLLLALLLTGCALSLPNQTMPVARIAYVTSEGGIATISASGGQPTIIASPPTTSDDGRAPRRYAWPAWAPDGQRLAFMAYDRDGAAGAVYVASADGQRRVTVYESADGYPIYLDWAPDSENLALVVGGNETRRLLLTPADGASQPRQLSVGRRVFSAWSPDSQSLLIHVDDVVFGDALSQIYLIPIAPDGVAERIDVDGNNFRAPAWSPAATYQAIAGDNGVGTSALFLRDPDGVLRRFEDTGSAPAMVWSPDGQHLAWLDGQAAPFLYQTLHVADLARPARRQVVDEPLFAFFWSPDSTRLAYLTLDSANRSLNWRVVPADGSSAARTVVTFQPTREFVHLLTAFDQFSQSVGVWSPDSQSLLFAGWLPGDDRDHKSSGIYNAPLDGSGPKRFADGRIGFFPAPRLAQLGGKQ